MSRMRAFPQNLLRLQAPRSTHGENRSKRHPDKQDCRVNQFSAVEVISQRSIPGVPVKQRSPGSIGGAVFAISEAEEVAPHFPPVRNQPKRRGGGGEDRRAGKSSESLPRIRTAQ